MSQYIELCNVVMDPFSVGGLASSVVQFIEFGSKLVSEGHDICKSASSSLTENLELELIHTDLNELTRSLRSPDHPNNQSPTADEAALRHFAASCHTVTTELLNVFITLKIDNNSNDRNWQSFRQAVKSV